MTIELRSVRLKLERIRQQLIEEVERLVIDGNPSNEQPRVNSFHNREEAVDSTSNLERRIALENQKRNNLAEVKHALNKLEEGSYGTCDRCGQTIESGRLKVLPYTSYCKTCKDARKTPLFK
jgi:DnaK suppressor protein